ncbi:YfgM family protein [Pseudoxanthomonas suwonensis]|uniref:Ancillary SecYEG translocon subunit n=1 Tax=Pseudoxanthomonas suwonensis TaxID=314722 RepID=A0A0E3ULF8_9GAMM|nr:tetratricopeptide repeat protein [Pseudoxanthomonas suwonensis]AKC85441.1 membrane protein [Pseudoxanthomonas suwonensis]
MAIDDLLDEHEQGERVRSWLRNNALGILGGLALGILAIYGWRWWGSHQAQQQQQAHSAYTEAVRQLEEGAVDQAGALLAGQAGTYATLAALRVAKSQVEAGKAEEAIATLRGIQAEPTLQPVVNERLAQLLNATGKPDEALKALEGQGGSAALELRGDALFASGKRDEARDAYAQALTGTDVASPSRRRVELKLQEAGGQVPEPAEAI